nr:hypothetical protein [Rhodococcus sp. (in: high G+C Gram-positive bacteria)]
MQIDDGDELSHDASRAGDDGPFTLEVESETFTVGVRREHPNTYDYDWVSGPNKNYGFSSTQQAAYRSVVDRAGSPSGFAPPTIDEHRESIRDFLRQVNPATGYIGD